jgi:hypothetical protein
LGSSFGCAIVMMFVPHFVVIFMPMGLGGGVGTVGEDCFVVGVWGVLH